MNVALLSVLLVSQGFPPPGQGGPGGPGGMGGPNAPELKVRKKFDANEDGYLNSEERAQARAYVKQQRGNPQRGGRMGGPGGGPGGPGGRNAGTPGPKLTPNGVKHHPEAHLYDGTILRTLFLEFENEDWEAEMADFYNTDVDVPAFLTVDGKQLPKQVGVAFRGASSFMGVPAGNKRSFNVSIDLVDDKQRLYGFKTLNLLNSNGDPTFMSTSLYSFLARPHIPTPRANHVKVAVNGESWGIYANVEQFNNDFVTEHFKSAQVEGKSGARWKVHGSPQGDGGLSYHGDNLAAYEQRYEIKSKDNPADWEALIELTRVLAETPLDRLEAEARKILDVDGVLWFLALDIGLINSDGYWTRASDYNIYRDPKGIFHVIPHDMNEAMRAGGRGPGGPGGPGGFPGGPRGGPGGPGGGGVTLDPLTGLNDQRKPLRSRLLQVPALRKQYLDNLRTLAREGLEWNHLGAKVAQMRQLLMKEIELDTRKNSTYESFLASTAPDGALRTFADARRKFLLEYREAQ